MANAFLPPARLIFAASQTNELDADHATSLELIHLKCQVSLSFDGREDGSVTSFSERIITVLSLSFAVLNLLICSGVNTSAGFCNSPEPTTISFADVVILKSKFP